MVETMGRTPEEIRQTLRKQMAEAEKRASDARELVNLVRGRGGAVGPKYGWTDVARFSAAGVPALNLGPGDPMQCHTDDEHCPLAQIEAVAAILRDWLA